MKSFFTFCAICCFIGILRLPIEYYTFLRILISIGALLAVYLYLLSKNQYVSIIFLVILIIFNPVLPIYLYQKGLWIPIDTITGVMFLLIAFVEIPDQKKQEIESTEEPPAHSNSIRSPSRDRIINPKPTKKEQTHNG
jgi:predicted membrane protein